MDKSRADYGADKRVVKQPLCVIRVDALSLEDASEYSLRSQECSDEKYPVPVDSEWPESHQDRVKTPVDSHVCCL
ncbi:hypothetical protein D3C76_775000 [compost metagenome]